MFEFDVSVPRDADIVTTKKKVTTSEEPGSAPRRNLLGQEAADADDPQQQGQRGAGPGTSARTPPRNRTLRFEYDLAAQQLTLNEDYVAPMARPRWATLSPDGQTVIFARNHNLYMMDAANFAKAQKSAGATSIVETQLTTDGEEFYSYARSRQQDQQIQEQQQQQQQQDQQDQQDRNQQDTTTNDKNARVPPVNIIWSPDSRRFALIRRDERKVKDLWVINALSNPRPTLETYRYAMPALKTSAPGR